MKKKIELTMTLCLLAAAFILAKQGAILVQTNAASKEPSSESSDKLGIVVDAGHGNGI